MMMLPVAQLQLASATSSIARRRLHSAAISGLSVLYQPAYPMTG
jgi:hypothetical protein